MADVRTQTHHISTHPQHGGRFDGGGGKGLMHHDRGVGGPSVAKIMAVMASLPVGGTLLALAGFTLLATMVGAAIATPLFIIFSPVLVPAAIAVGLAVTGFLTSGVFGITALSALSWVLRYIRQTRGTVPEQMDQAKRRMQDMAGYVGQKTKETGQQIQNKAHEAGGGGGGATTGGRTTDAGHK